MRSRAASADRERVVSRAPAPVTTPDVGAIPSSSTDRRRCIEVCIHKGSRRRFHDTAEG